MGRRKISQEEAKSIENQNCLLGGRIRDLRLERSKTQGDLARELGVSVPTVSQIENGNRALSAVEFFQVALALDCRVETLWSSPSDVLKAQASTSAPSPVPARKTGGKKRLEQRRKVREELEEFQLNLARQLDLLGDQEGHSRGPLTTPFLGAYRLFGYASARLDGLPESLRTLLREKRARLVPIDLQKAEERTKSEEEDRSPVSSHRGLMSYYLVRDSSPPLEPFPAGDAETASTPAWAVRSLPQTMICGVFDQFASEDLLQAAIRSGEVEKALDLEGPPVAIQTGTFAQDPGEYVPVRLHSAQEVAEPVVVPRFRATLLLGSREGRDHLFLLLQTPRESPVSSDRIEDFQPRDLAFPLALVRSRVPATLASSGVVWRVADDGDEARTENPRGSSLQLAEFDFATDPGLVPALDELRIGRRSTLNPCSLEPWLTRTRSIPPGLQQELRDPGSSRGLVERARVQGRRARERAFDEAKRLLKSKE